MNYLTDELEKLLPFVGQNDHILREILKVFTRLKEQHHSTEPLQTSALRKALFLNSRRGMGSNSCLIQLPDVGKQEEQDVAEFLTWILNLLSSSLKRLKQAEGEKHTWIFYFKVHVGLDFALPYYVFNNI